MTCNNNREQYNAYMKEYMLERYNKFKTKWTELLGGKCVQCNSTEDLQFDYIDPSTKKYTIAAGWSYKDIEEEIKKCQLLCVLCHRKKTLIDLNQNDAKIIHGTLSAYKYCKCDLCKKAKSDWQREYSKGYRLKKKIKSWV